MCRGSTFSTAYRLSLASSTTIAMARSSLSYWHSSCSSPLSFFKHSQRQTISIALSVSSLQTMACRYLSSLLLAWRTGVVLELHTQPLSRWVALFRLQMGANGLSGSGNSMANGWASLFRLALYCGCCSFLTTMSLYVLPTTRFASVKGLISIIVSDSTGLAISLK